MKLIAEHLSNYSAGVIKRKPRTPTLAVWDIAVDSRVKRDGVIDLSGHWVLEMRPNQVFCSINYVK